MQRKAGTARSCFHKVVQEGGREGSLLRGPRFWRYWGDVQWRGEEGADTQFGMWSHTSLRRFWVLWGSCHRKGLVMQELSGLASVSTTCSSKPCDAVQVVSCSLFLSSFMLLGSVSSNEAVACKQPPGAQVWQKEQLKFIFGSENSYLLSLG